MATEVVPRTIHRRLHIAYFGWYCSGKFSRQIVTNQHTVVVFPSWNSKFQSWYVVVVEIIKQFTL